MEAIIAGDYKFEPAEYWANVSDTAKDFVRTCLTIDPNQRPTATESLNHSWLADKKPHFVPDPASPHGGPMDLLPHIQQRRDAKTRFRKAVWGITAMKRMSLLASSHHVSELERQVNQYKEESEKASSCDHVFRWARTHVVYRRSLMRVVMSCTIIPMRTAKKRSKRRIT